MAVPLLDLRRQYLEIRAGIDARIADVVESQHFILGPRVAAFESSIRDYIGCGAAIGVSSGTDAELLILMALGVGPGDAVITTPYTFFATAGCIHRVGAEIVFADIDAGTFNIDPDKVGQLTESRLERAADGRLRTRRGSIVRAIVPVHLFGQCARIEPILDFAAANDLVVIEDAAQALGAECRVAGAAVRAGAIAPFGFVSFYPAKNLGAFGDAGLAVCRDPAMADRLRIVRDHGMHQRYYHSTVGGNFRMDAIQAAVLEAKLPFLESWNARRRANAALYDAMFRDAGLGEFITWPAPVGTSELRNRHVFHQYVIRSPRRDELREHLGARGIGHAVYYPVPLHHQQCFASLAYRDGELPEAERAAAESLALPIFPELRVAEIAAVVDAVREFFRGG